MEADFRKRREKLLEAFDEAVAWLTGTTGAQIAIFDASNVTIQRRAKLQKNTLDTLGSGDLRGGVRLGGVGGVRRGRQLR